MTIFRSIKSKIWACVSIALLAYLVATGLATFSNYRSSASLTLIEQVHIPLAFSANALNSLLKLQRQKYEEGLLVGDAQEVAAANSLNEEIEKTFNQMISLASSGSPEVYPDLLSLRDHYNEYFSLAEIYYLAVADKEDIFASHRELYQLGQLRNNIENRLQDFSKQLRLSVTAKIEDEKYRAFSNSRLLLVLFVIIFVIIFQVINQLSSEILIKPLQLIDSMIRNFGRGRSIERPEDRENADEIHTLAMTFWEMSEEQKKLTVSRDYVDNILRNMSDALVVLSPDLIVEKVNQSALDLFNVQAQEIIHYPAHIFFSSHAQAGSNSNLLKEVIAGKKVNNYEMSVYRKECSEIPVLFSGRAFYHFDGSVQGIVCLVKDISDYKTP